MSTGVHTKLLLRIAATTIAWGFSVNVFAATFDAEAAKARPKERLPQVPRGRQEQERSGIRDIAAKYKGKEAEGETKMMKNLTTGPKVKLEDGSEEEHKIIDAKDQAEAKNLIYWILSM